MRKTEKTIKTFVVASIAQILAFGLFCCIIVAGENTERIISGTEKQIISYEKYGKRPFDFIFNMW